MNHCFSLMSRSSPLLVIFPTLSGGHILTKRPRNLLEGTFPTFQSWKKETVCKLIGESGSVSRRHVDYDLFMEGIPQEERESACSGRAGRKELTGQDDQGENVKETKGQGHMNLLETLCHTRGRWADRSDELKEVHETQSVSF